MSGWWAALWDRLGRVPAAVWAGLAVAVSIGLLVLRGRRLEAELAQAKVREHSARAKAVTAKAQGRREVHEEAADLAAAEAVELEAEAVRVEVAGSHERERILELSSTERNQEYIELARRARERARSRK